MNKTTNISIRAARIGIDIGRVVICPTDATRGPDTSFLTVAKQAAMHVPPAPGAELVIRALVLATGGNVWFVSKAGARVAELTRDWFRHNDFHTRTSTTPDRVHFCRERHEKRGIAERLGLTHFIDDRADVLKPMLGVVPNLYLFGVQSKPAPAWCRVVTDWFAIEQLLLEGELPPTRSRGNG